MQTRRPFIQLERSILTSPLARRIFFNFVACALLPVLVLASVALFQVTRQLEQQADQRLRQAAKGYGLSIYEHLLFCEDELKLVGVRSRTDTRSQEEKFESIARYHASGRVDAIQGEPMAPPRLQPRETAHLAQGNSLMVLEGNPIRIALARYVDGKTPAAGLIMGTVRPAYLWGLEQGNSLPPLSSVAISTASGLPLYRSSTADPGASASHLTAANPSTDIQLPRGEWMSANWPLFLEPKFSTGSWSILIWQPQEHILAPIERFKLLFILVVVLALLMVVALSLFHLRHSLAPIQALKEGADRIAGKDFSHRVEVGSKDEFEQLAGSFNAMSSQLGRQFQMLSTQAQIDQATLMARDFGHIAALSIRRILKDFGFHLAAICRVKVDDPDEALIYLGRGADPDGITSQPFAIEGHHLKRFRPDRPWIPIHEPGKLDRYLPAGCLGELTTAILFPVFVKNQLYAVLAIGQQSSPQAADNRWPLLRQVADHLAVAWSNVKLIRDLRHLTIGSMRALARAVDAKSPWTAGHSARVMRISLGIARQIGLGAEQSEQLQQAALLHDIGKIGVPSAILDKPGKLTDEEFAAIRKHPEIGDTILGPIEAFRSVVPMVRQHHERWDGNGYPDGLAGSAITLEARILAVADVYDAMTSDRPYRKGMDAERVLSVLASESGRQFDPDVVRAFLEMMKQKSPMAA